MDTDHHLDGENFELFARERIHHGPHLLGLHLLVSFGQTERFLVRQLLAFELGEVQFQLFDHQATLDRMAPRHDDHRQGQRGQFLLPATEQLWREADDLVVALVAFLSTHRHLNTIFEERNRRWRDQISQAYRLLLESLPIISAMVDEGAMKTLDAFLPDLATSRRARWSSFTKHLVASRCSASSFPWCVL